MWFRDLLVPLFTVLVACAPSASTASATDEAPAKNEPTKTASDVAPTATDDKAKVSTEAKAFAASIAKDEVGKWTWHDIPGMICGNGEPTGIAVNVGTTKELAIFLEGGGACWDEATCADLGIASNIDGYTKEKFEAEMQSDLAELHGGIYDRDVPTNPYRNATLVYVPYCTGDVFAGDSTQEFFLPPRTMHYAGRTNIEAMLKTIVPEFKDASKVTFSGSSAGGFGAAINYWRVKEAFGTTPVDLIDDSGPPFNEWEIPLMPIWRFSWSFDGALPQDCPACQSNIGEVPAYYAKKYPNDHFAYLSHDFDGVISIFFATLPPIFALHLHEMDDKIALLPNARFYVVPGLQHMMLSKLTTTSNDVELSTFLTQLDTASPQWANVAP